jgi:isopropylmalate/homocitrate/citramalate synthase
MAIVAPQVFTDADLEGIRSGLAELRTPGAYEPGKWMVSKYNRDPRVVGSAGPRRVVIRDITLRTTEQLGGVIVSAEERLEFLKQLVQAGVPSVQVSRFHRGHTLEEMRREVQAVKAINPDCELVYGGATSEADIELAAESGYDAVQIWSAYLGKAAASCAGAVYHRAWGGREWRNLNFPTKPHDQVERSVRMVEWGNKHGVKVGGSVNLLSYATEEYVHDYCTTVAEAGAYEIGLADGASGCAPEAVGFLTRIAKEASGLPIAVHLHNGFGLAIACTVAAVHAGADVVEVAVNEYEHGATQADLAATAVCLEAMYGYQTGIDFSKMVELSRLAERMTQQPIDPHHPVTGRDIFECAGADEYVQEYKVDPLIHCALVPEFVGNKREINISYETGPFTMWDKLDEVGVQISEQSEVEKILAQCKARLLETKTTLSSEEIRDIAESVVANGSSASV